MVCLLQIISAAALAAVATPDHLVTFKNRCASQTITPAFHAADGTSRYMAAIGNGGTTTTTVAALLGVAHVWADQVVQLSRWQIHYRAGCTLLECNFDNPSFGQCNLSRVSGFNVGMEFSWTDGGCSGNYCLHNTCDGDRAFSTPDNGGPSLRQCNTPNVGMTVTFSCDP
ncbi:hypothetical protein B0H17DRAFT_1198969 [Mycena rosella]|uniref:Cyanovirin-N domain-containing protein n=1 Tax=Mycena rosella TaxID=1033263 RepID=A0AAD7DMP4_MYCRO|nr:hypothetical protein B0H17DRAFT_1198969 [Mycena rosella]